MKHIEKYIFEMFSQIHTIMDYNNVEVNLNHLFDTYLKYQI